MNEWIKIVLDEGSIRKQKNLLSSNRRLSKKIFG
jgi:hypothetical protein